MQNTCSGLAYIQVDGDSNPFRLFQEWKDEAEKCGNLAPSVMNLATYSRNNGVSNRSLLILKYEDDGFLFLTSRGGRKVRDIEENPNVAATFLWVYSKEGKFITRQVRIEGILKELDKGTTEIIYNATPTHAKIRTHICDQSQPVEWQKLKNAHDEFLSKVMSMSNGEEINMPDHIVGFKLLPRTFDFYYAYDKFIADRVTFTNNNQKWDHYHLQA